MEPTLFPEELPERKVSVVGSELVENYTVYIIEVTDGEHKWKVKHRYSDFHDLHEKLVVEKKVDRGLLPPKKMLGKNSKSLVERRQKDLELYLQTLLQQFPQATPTTLASFLHFHLYEISGITEALAKELFHKGEQLLQAGEVFSLCPLQLFAVSQKLRLAKPTCCNGDARTDLGHILDFTCRLRYLKMCGSRGPVGTSNILESALPFDLSIFKSLLQIELSECSSQQIQGLSSLRPNLATLSIRHSTETMMSILVPEASELSHWEPEGVESDGAVTVLIPVWKNLTTLDMSHNSIKAIDRSVKLIPKVEFLDLSHNQLSTVENLQHLYNLVHVDLSYNNLRVLEAAHTRLGNIKTLNLAGNQLDQLTGLTKLYSLVNLDLSHNQLAQLEEIRNIGSLPCLEKLNLSSNPVCIFPDYRTKVLAQFGDRAAEVCLDCKVTTEKELDTVEVLKAIQKAKEVKDRKSGGGGGGGGGGSKKISEETRLSAAAAAAPPPPPLPQLSSSSTSSSPSSYCASAVAPPPVDSSASASSSSCSAQQAARPSQDVTSRDDIVPPSALPPVDPATPPVALNTGKHLTSAAPAKIQHISSLSKQSHCGTSTRITTTPANNLCCTCCSSSRPAEPSCFFCLNTSRPPPSAQLLSASVISKDFVARLSSHLGPILRDQNRKRTREGKKGGDVRDQEEEEEEEEEGRREERILESQEVQSHVESTEVESHSQGSMDGYFEMSLDESVEESVCCPSISLALPPANNLSGHQGELCAKEEDEDESKGEEQETEEDVKICRVLWCYCLQVEEEVEQREACLLLCDQLVGLLFLPGDFTWTDQGPPPVEEVLSGLQLELTVPYSRLLLPSQAELPSTCLALGVLDSSTRWYIFSDAEELRRTRADLTRLIQAAGSQTAWATTTNPPQLLPRSLVNSWELEESQAARGGYAAHFLSSLPSDSSGADAHPLLSDVLPGRERPGLPLLLFLSHRHLWVLKIDFRELTARARKSPDVHHSSCCRLVRVPLGSVVVHPGQSASPVGGGDSSSRCADPGHRRRSRHSVQLLVAGQRLLLLFPLAQDGGSFLRELNQRRASLEGLKMVPLPAQQQHQGQHTPGHSRSKHQCCCTCTRTSHNTHRWDSSPLQAEDNQPSSHLLPGLSPGLKIVAGLQKEQLLACFHKYIAMSESEEVRQVLWLSVVLYKSPESELTCCLLLSTDAIYFLLEDSASALGHQSVLDSTESGDPDVCMCCCLSIRLSDLLSVNVGLFDQYFRVVGRSPDHIVCCLSRDSYGTSVFLQELMSALSLQQQLPPPEPSEQDFYSQFTNTNTGKMHNYELVHSSRVKFIYPSEEEMGDLTFIVAERKTAASSAPSSSRSFNVLLYLLVFQVHIPCSPPGQVAAHLSHPALNSGSDPTPVLQPRTLILTGTDVFLLDEDYVSYPLPDFAKEPPSRERYQLREARRIRDLDRVLLGYQTYPQALTLVFDDLPGPDLLCHLTMDHFAAAGEESALRGGGASGGAEGEVQWCVFVPGADSRERLISLLARQWEALCSRELPVELTG